jgi:aminopeptidase N
MAAANRYISHSKRFSWIVNFIIIITFITSTQFSLASYKPSIQRNYDTQHIEIELNFNHNQQSISGKATITVVPFINNLSSLEFHAKDMEIQDVMLVDRNHLDFTADSETVAIALPYSYGEEDTITIVITYFTQPTAGFYFNEPTENDPKKRHQIYSHSEPIYARCWFPCYDEPDDKLTSEIIATVPENYYLLSNGKLLSVYHNQSRRTKTFHWLQDRPHTTYLISIAAGEYREILDGQGDIPICYYVYEDQVEIAPNSFAKTPRMIEFFQDLFGYQYPWDKYAQIVIADYQAAGMEHTSATSLHDRTIHDDRAHLDVNSDDLVAHELAHQWFGNLVTCKDWSHIWLNEGFATYAEILFKEFESGPDEAQYAIYQDQKFYLEMVDPKFHQPIVYENFLHPEEMFSYIEYQKAGQVLHTLRYVVGDSLFFKSLKTYLNRFAYQSVVTSDFQQVMEEATGQKLDWFFSQWLYRGGHPKFVIASKWVPESSEVYLYVRQTQFDSLGLVPQVFQIPVEVEIIGESDHLNKKIFIKTREDTFKFSFDNRPQLIRFDKNNWILKETNFIKSQDEWIYQLLHDEHVAARLKALEELELVTFDTLETVLALEQCLVDDPFWAVRKEAAYLLIDYHRPESKPVLIKACGDSHPKVRDAAILTLSYYYDKKLNPLFREIADHDSSYKVVAEALYALSNVTDDSTFDFLSKFVDIDSHNDVIRTAAFHSLRHIKDERAIPIAIRFVRDRSQPEYIRANALSILKEIGTGHEEVETVLIEIIKDSNNFIKKKAIDILGLFKTEKSLHVLKKLQDSALPDDVRRRLKISIEKIERGLGNN